MKPVTSKVMPSVPRACTLAQISPQLIFRTYNRPLTTGQTATLSVYKLSPRRERALESCRHTYKLHTNLFVTTDKQDCALQGWEGGQSPGPDAHAQLFTASYMQLPALAGPLLLLAPQPPPPLAVLMEAQLPRTALP